ncbi:MAG TPA: hypothetical protein VNN55_10030 [bacterium]|nr:hypothetical protein [bacterium]
MATRLALIGLAGALVLVPATVTAPSRWTVAVETGVATGGCKDVRLRLDGDGAVPRTARLADATFDAGTAVESYYRFDSYRLTYAHDLNFRPGLRVAGGVTAKIRDATIRLMGATQDAVRTNGGFVPRLYAVGARSISSRLRRLLEADAPAGLQWDL